MACNNRNYQKSTFKASAVSQTIASGGNLPLTVQNVTGNAIQLANGGQAVNLKKAGLYLVLFHATITPTAENEVITMQLNRNGIADINGTATRTPETATDIENFNFSTIIEVDTVCCGGANFIPLTFTNTGTSAIYNIASVEIIKLA